MALGFFKKEEKNLDLKWCEELYFKFNKEKQKEIETFLNNHCFVHSDMNFQINRHVKELDEIDKNDHIEKEDVKRVKLILLILWFEAMRDLDEVSARRINEIRHPSLRKQ